MRRHLLTLSATLLLIVPSIASAAGLIVLYPADGAGYQETCNFIAPAESGVREVVMVLVLGGGDTFLGVDSFDVHSININWIPLEIVSSDWTVLGGPSGAQVSFGSCQAPPVVIATIRFFGYGNSPCGQVWIEPLTPGQLLLKCDYSLTDSQVAPMTVNGVYDVPPGGFDPDCYCPTVESEPSSWGKVKALYQD